MYVHTYVHTHTATCRHLTGKNIYTIPQEYLQLPSARTTLQLYILPNMSGPHYTALGATFGPPGGVLDRPVLGRRAYRLLTQ